MQAFDAAVKAATLEPANWAYTVDIGEALLALNRDQDAARLLARMQRDARSPSEKSKAESFAKRVTNHQRHGSTDETTTDAPTSAVSTGLQRETTQAKQNVAGIDSQTAAQTSNVAQEGVIREVTCGTDSGVSLQFAILGTTLSLRSINRSQIAIRVAGKDSTLFDVPCEQWKGRKARIVFADFSMSEIVSIDFL